MKINSEIWKADLFTAVNSILKLATFKCYNKRQTDKFEKEIILAVFCVRILIERKKLSKRILDKEIDVIKHPKKSLDSVTWLNSNEISELYDLDKSEPTKFKTEYLCNQIIHSYILIPVPEKNQFTHILVCSDRRQATNLYRISVENIISLLNEVISDNLIDV